MLHMAARRLADCISTPVNCLSAKAFITCLRAPGYDVNIKKGTILLDAPDNFMGLPSHKLNHKVAFHISMTKYFQQGSGHPTINNNRN